MERSNSMARGKRPLDPIGSDEGQPEKKRPALARYFLRFLFSFSQSAW